MTYHILLLKETRANEQRVALVPNDIKLLIEDGNTISVEAGAGTAAGFSDAAYQDAGAIIRHDLKNNLEFYQNFFKDIDIIVRAKRPERAREILENNAIKANTIMIGALDPLEKNSLHMHEYEQAGIKAYSIDQFNFATDDPRNVLSAMSAIAGKLALLDAIDKHQSEVNNVVIIGYGVSGQAALKEALNKKLNVTVMLRDPQKGKAIEKLGAKAILLDKNMLLPQIQNIIYENIQDADVVITSARKANESAPLLIPASTLQKIQKGCVIVDLALSEGGNVEGSVHDATLHLGNDVIVTNVSGYPKVMPHEASKLWSNATFHFISSLIANNFSF